MMDSDQDVDDLVDFNIDSVDSDKEEDKTSEEEEFGEYDLDKEIDRLDSLSRLDKEEEKNLP